MRRFNVEGHVSGMSALPWKDETLDAVLSILFRQFTIITGGR